VLNYGITFCARFHTIARQIIICVNWTPIFTTSNVTQFT
jgi:hypothetical protein